MAVSAAWNLSRAQPVVFVVQSKQTCRKNKRPTKLARRRLEEGFDYTQALAKLEIPAQNLRGKIYRQSKALRQYGKTKDHDQKAVTKKVSTSETPEREKEIQLHHVGSNLPRKSSIRKNRTRRDCGTWDHIATSQDKSNGPKYQRTKSRQTNSL